MKSLLIYVLVVLAVPPLMSQTITVRLLNGKTGKPMADKNVRFLWDDRFPTSVDVVHIGKDGTAYVTVPKGAKTFSLEEGPKAGKEAGRIAYADCTVGGAQAAENPASPTSIAKVLGTGVVLPNICSKRIVPPEPGVIVFWGLPRPWFVPDMQ
jgi:hypothetical protein